METDGDGRELMEMYKEICRIDPSMKDVIKRIMNDILSVTYQEAAQLEKLYMEYLEKTKE